MQWGFAVRERETVPNSEYNKEKWEFTAKEQVGVSGWTLPKEETSGIGGDSG